MRPTTLLNFPGTVLTSFLKYAAHWGVYGDACCSDDTDDVAPWEEDVVRIICIEDKRPDIVVSVSTQDDIFNDLGGSPRGPDFGRFVGIDNVSIGKVIELVSGSSGLFPYPQTEIAVLRRPSGVHDFRPIAVPLDVARVYRRIVRWAFLAVALGGERHFPEPDDRDIVGIVLGNHEKRRGPECCPAPGLRRNNGASLMAREIRQALGACFCGKDGSNQDYAESCCDSLKCCFHAISFELTGSQVPEGFVRPTIEDRRSYGLTVYGDGMNRVAETGSRPKTRSHARPRAMLGGFSAQNAPKSSGKRVLVRESTETG